MSCESQHCPSPFTGGRQIDTRAPASSYLRLMMAPFDDLAPRVHTSFPSPQMLLPIPAQFLSLFFTHPLSRARNRLKRNFVCSPTQQSNCHHHCALLRMCLSSEGYLLRTHPDTAFKTSPSTSAHPTPSAIELG